MDAERVDRIVAELDGWIAALSDEGEPYTGAMHVERLGDEVLLSIYDSDDGTPLALLSLSVPLGVDELVEALLEARGPDD